MPLAVHSGARRGALFSLAVVLLHLVLAWPGADRRGVIAEELLPYLRHYPQVLEIRGTEGIVFWPPYDDAELRRAVDSGQRVAPRLVGTEVWPELAYHGADRVWPLAVRGHQTALGTWWGMSAGPWLGDGIAGVRRSSVILGAILVLMVAALGRRVGLGRGWAAAAALGCVLSPGLWFFCRTGYGFELASRVAMLIALVLAALPRPMSRRRALLVGAAVAAAILCRVTIAVTLLPALAILLADPARWPGRARASLTLLVGLGLPAAGVGLAALALPFRPGGLPGADLAVAELAARTLGAPMMAIGQLAWVTDARVILQPLLEGGVVVPTGVWRPAFAALVLGVAADRWRRGRAGAAERMFCAALLAHAVIGAWLYGDPAQFQLGMALEPLFVLAVATQLCALARARPRLAAASVASLLLVRAGTLASVYRSERTTDNPMLSGTAQRTLLAQLYARDLAGVRVLTTSYDHVGVLEGWSGESYRPLHAWPVLKRGHELPLVERWELLLAAHRPCAAVLTRAPNLVAGSFTDDEGVARALALALARRGVAEPSRTEIRGDGGGVVFELVEWGSCGPEPDAPVRPPGG